MFGTATMNVSSGESFEITANLKVMLTDLMGCVGGSSVIAMSLAAL